MNNSFKLLFLFIALFAVKNIEAQNAKLDSLENCLKNRSLEDTLKVNLLNESAYYLYKSDSAKAFRYTNEAVELAGKLNFRKGLAKSYYVIGLSLSYHESVKHALEYYLKALKIAEEINSKKDLVNYLNVSGVSYAALGQISEAAACYRRSIQIAEEIKDQDLLIRSKAYLSINYTGRGDYEKALAGYQEILKLLETKDDKIMSSTIFNNIGEIHKYQGNYPQALEFYYKALNLFEQRNDEAGISLSFTNIGSIFNLQGDYEKAVEFEYRALKIAEKLNNKRLICSSYEEIGIAFMKSNKPEALDYFQKALTIAEKLNFKTPIIRVLTNMGDFFRLKGDYKKAIEIYSRALTISEELSRKRTICEISTKLGEIYFLQKEYAKALDYNQKGLVLSTELKLLDSQMEIHKQLAEIYSATNNFQKAYRHYKLFTEKSDSVYNEKNIKKIAELEYSYKFEKEKQALELAQIKKDAVNKSIQYSLIAGFILMSIFAVYVFRSSRIYHKINQILTLQKREIQDLNEEYQLVNEELVSSHQELLRTKNQVEERENLLIQITDNIPVNLSLVDTNLVYQFANDGYAELFNRQKGEISGQKVEAILNPENYKRAYPNIMKTLEGERVTYENRLQHNSSQRILQTAYVPYYQHDVIQGLIVCSSDITERKKAEIALQEFETAKAQLLTDEIDRINRELEANQKSMTAATLKLIQNSERDAQTIDRLLEIEKDSNPEAKQKIKALIADNKRISYNSNWDEFEILFEKVHSSFYEKLNSLFPTLTANERKMCAFLKLNMSNKDIAQITFQSDDALKKARLRLRQKLVLDRETNLSAFLQNI